VRGIPTAAELAAALRQTLADELVAATSGRERFLARVAAHTAGIVERELLLGPAAEAAHAERLAALGVADDAELAAAIRSGALDARRDEVVAAVRASVVERLRIDNPRHLLPRDRGGPRG
jgi:hypothetical protein